MLNLRTLAILTPDILCDETCSVAVPQQHDEARWNAVGLGWGSQGALPAGCRERGTSADFGCDLEGPTPSAKECGRVNFIVRRNGRVGKYSIRDFINPVAERAMGPFGPRGSERSIDHGIDLPRKRKFVPPGQIFNSRVNRFCGRSIVRRAGLCPWTPAVIFRTLALPWD